MDKRLTDETFAYVLEHAEDITYRFEVDLGGLPQDILQATADARPHVEVLRTAMEQHWLDPDVDLAKVRYGMIDMAAWAQTHGKAVEQAIKDGTVGAVDGTPVVPHQRYITAQVFACAVGYLTSRMPLDLVTKLVKTHAPAGEVGTLEAVVDFMEQAEVLTDSRSWPAAFMEYLERERAADCPSQHIIVDGPIVTQNLLTRKQGRDLLTRMLTDSSRSYVGVIKDILRSSIEMRFYARALRAGELYIQETLQAILAPRLDTYGGDVVRFVNTIGTDVLRGVFKPGRKAFGFECRRSDLPTVVSLLWLDRNEQPGYELPFLLVQVDALLRGRYRPGETVTAIEAVLAEKVEAEFFDELDERSLR